MNLPTIIFKIKSNIIIYINNINKMINNNKILHQIFMSVNGSKIQDYPIYIEGQKKWLKWCKKHKYKYNYVTGATIQEYYLTDPKIRDFYNNLKYDWQRIDFAKYLIINKDGGVYIDLDIHPANKKNKINLAQLFEYNEYIIGVWYDKKKEKLTPSNSIIYFSKKNKLNSLIKYSMEQTLLKSSMPVYDTWIKRYMLHTTGVRMFIRWVNKNKIKYNSDISKYIKDYETAAWHTNFG
jgi:mannosyltransferase OCH1-like enzyme